jgi:hypothetical protein
MAYATAQAKEAERVAEQSTRVEARWFAWAVDAEAAMAEDEGRGQGRRGRTPRPWRYHDLHYRVEAVSVPTKRARRGRPPQAKAPQVETRYRLRVPPEALVPSEDAHGWTVLATTVGPEKCTDAEMRREPGVYFQTATAAGLAGLFDPQVLERAATEGRVLVSHDQSTMPQHFAAFIQNQPSAGLLIVPQHLSYMVVAEELLLIWAASEAEEWLNRIAYLPL